MIVILKACRKEIEALPEEIRGDLADALARLDAGLALTLPPQNVLRLSPTTTRIGS